MQPVAGRILRIGSSFLQAGRRAGARSATSSVRPAQSGASSISGLLVPGLLFAALLGASQQAALAQFIQNGPKLVGTGGIGNPEQGYSVALSANGHTAIVGGPNDGPGAAWVFTRSAGSWSQQGAKLVGTGVVGGAAHQGQSVALSADGNTAIVGGWADNGGIGASWIFTRTGGVWTQDGAKLIGTGAVGNAQQGISVALSGDGNTAIVGGYGDNGNIGAAWVFTRSGGTWSQQGAKLVGTGGAGTVFQGFSVALSGDGNTAIVGGYGDNGNGGAAWVFTRNGGTWSQQGTKLVGSGATGAANQGYSVALSADGNTAIVGGYADDGNTGAAWIFTRNGAVWSQQGTKLIGTGAVGSANQGRSVALSGGGNTAIVGGNADNNNAGAAWVFTRNDGVWSQEGNKLVGSGAGPGAQQGWSVALSCDTAVVGGYFDNLQVGAAWAFVAPPTMTHDFNDDCRSDILWYNNANGQVVAWLLDGASVIGGGSPGLATSPWAIVAQRDLNGDGSADILWRNATSGQLVVWLLSGSTPIGGGWLGTVASDWSIAGSGDFNGDGFGDVLWYNSSTGQVVIWLANGTSVIGGGSPGSAASPWTIAGIADFSGDGMSDVLWYNSSTGQAVIWLLNGTSVTGGGSPGAAASPWTIAGTGDFNGDGLSDIAWLNGTSGQAVVWLLNGTSVIGGGSPGSMSPPWTIAETGDFNGDNKSDILWYNATSGQLMVWLLDAASVIRSASSGSAPSPWLVQGPNAD